MKISNNMSPGVFRFSVNFQYAISFCFLASALFFRQHVIDLIICSAIVFIATKVFISDRDHFQLEVYDLGGHLKLKMDADEFILALSELEMAKICDGKDGLDWVEIYANSENKFGKLIRFYPDMVKIPCGRLDVWVGEFNQRIAAARSTILQ